MRRGQSTVETLLVITAVVGVLVLGCWIEMDPLVRLVGEVAERIQAAPWFDGVARFFSGSDV